MISLRTSLAAMAIATAAVMASPLTAQAAESGTAGNGVGASVAAASVPPSADLYGCTYKIITGSGGHQGSAITCKGSSSESFVGWVKCRDVSGNVYESYGPQTWANNASTAWCALGYRVIGSYYYAV
ncbi:hypothetical protein OG730_40320 [Streptomyces sp. NBC_01298]|uniref:hypothetical protein n=1 Tax=Streptomyces sp. NBC_01298 TaxID=2903817 RepID=UPI002E11B5CC|nr:hypothetical protein OG730_40320 [Streptomyces sp. NBC_01298]